MDKVVLLVKTIGVFYYNNGRRYEGDWKDGKRNGKGNLQSKSIGILYFNNGNWYDGEWKSNNRDGLGIGWVKV